MELLSGLSAQEAELVVDLVSALKLKATSKLAPSSDICSEQFSADFVSRLKVYHALNDDVLKKKTFEYAFARALSKSGRVAVVTDNSVLAGEDVLVDGVKYSLKTEASKSIRPGSITISKLMEARWIRECTDSDSILSSVRANVVAHLRRYDRILILRAFKGASYYRYRLVEIPVGLLLKMNDLEVNSFKPRTSNGSSRATVYVDGLPAYSVILDGSVEKITINSLVESLCFVHGEWQVPVAGVLEHAG